MRRLWIGSLFASVVSCALGCAESVRDSDAANDARADMGTVDAGGDVVVTDTTMQPVDVPATDTGVEAGLMDQFAYGHLLYLAFNGEEMTILSPRIASIMVSPYMETAVNSSLSPLFTAAENSFSAGWRERRQANIDAVTAKVREVMAPFDIQVVTRRPPFEGGYYRIVIGGDDLEYERTQRCGVREGFAFLLCGVPDLFNPGTSVHAGAVLSGCITSPFTQTERIALVAAHEFGHASSLEHIDTPSTIMFHSGGGDQWGVGTVVRGGDDMSGQGCGRTTQDGRSVLLSELGARATRPVLPPNADMAAPTWTRMLPADGARVPPGTRPCLAVADASEVKAVRVEVFRATSTAVGDQYLRVSQMLGTGAAPPSEVIAQGAITQPTDLYLRYTASDKWGNLAEERVRITIDPSAPALQCPTP